MIPDARPPLSPLSALSVLYVEDDDTIREQLSQFLRRRVGRLITAENGSEGLALFERHNPDIVITDILMPVMDGLQMAEKIKQKRCSTPVIVTTAFKESDYLMRALDLALDKYVLKPVNIRTLTEALESCARHLQDATERENAERRLREANESLEQRIAQRTGDLRLALEAAEQASRAKSTFLAGMSHELRTPLNGILGIAQSLQADVFGPLSGEQKMAVQLIEESGNHLLALVSDVLDLSKVEAKQMSLSVSRCDIRELCEASAALLRGVIEGKKQRLDVEIEASCGSIKADPMRLKQMLVNLLSNAAKFSPEGSTIRLDVYRGHPDEISFAVQDEGVGIDEADLPRLFLPFSQFGGAAQGSGTGLGLSLVKSMAELHGGRVAVRSAPGQGSRFTLTLPAGVSSSIPPPPSSPRPSSRLSLAGLDVLVAEDNRINAVVLRSYLSSAGCRVRVAVNGEEALAFARSRRPDLVLMDVQMPVMDGLRATRAFRDDPELCQVQIVALTANAMPGDRESCLEAGADDYLSKPIDLGALSALLSRFSRAGGAPEPAPPRAP